MSDKAADHCSDKALRHDDQKPRYDDTVRRYADGREETPNQRADRNWNEILQELRVAQTGSQIITGFLLAVAFQPRFEELDSYQLTLYIVLVVLAALATTLGLAPVSLHRRLFRRGQKTRIVRIGSRLLFINLVVVALLVTGVTGLIFDFVLGRLAGLTALGVTLIVIFVIWLGSAAGRRSRS